MMDMVIKITVNLVNNQELLNYTNYKLVFVMTFDLFMNTVKTLVMYHNHYDI